MISDRLKNILSESARLELIMENLGALNAYPKEMVKQLLVHRSHIGPSSKINVERYKTSAEAERALKADPKGVFVIVPPGEPALAILTPVSGGYGKQAYLVISNAQTRPSSNRRDSLGKVADYLYKGQITDVIGFFRALTNSYGKTWEMHKINVDAGRIEKRQERAKAKEGVAQFDTRRNTRAPYGSWSRADLMARLDSYKKAKAPELKDPSGVLSMIQSSGNKLPTKFRYMGITFELANSRHAVDEGKGTPYRGMGNLFGLEYRADHSEFWDAMKGVADEDSKKFLDTFPRYIYVDYELQNGSFVPGKVRIAQQ